MTMPCERTRALRWAGEFLREIQKSETATDEQKRTASVILRHYPSNNEIASKAKFSEKMPESFISGSWLAPEVDQNS